MVQIAISEDGTSFVEEVIDCSKVDCIVEPIDIDPAHIEVEVETQLAFDF
jgi:hypothetical protein